MIFERLNQLGLLREPFLVVADFKLEKVRVFLLNELSDADIEYSIGCTTDGIVDGVLEKQPIAFVDYCKKFNVIQDEIKAGNTYLLNLTQPTSIKTQLSLQEIYDSASAKYKLRFKDQFVCFSPEKFITIKDNIISTFPMKGTINASYLNARELILADAKEMAEHVMVVDLLRNDISMVASSVRVERFRYIETVSAGERDLLQVSSEIRGNLDLSWHENIGSILKTLLPAGSISGAPKIKTVEIISRVEEYERGYFTGIFGVYDGKSFDSGVMIRFIEKTENGYIYKSGGGITADSNANSEYEEMISKVYLP